jgi:hypothetical protein
VTIPTRERLARDLEAAGAPAEMIARARVGHYDDFGSDLPFPAIALHDDALAAGLTEIAEDVKRGRWDATPAESDAWAASPEGQASTR